eukprot:gene984-1250_t
MFSYCEGFRVDGVNDGNPLWKNCQPVDPNVKQLPSLYRSLFYGVKHKTFISYYSPVGPISVSIKRDGFDYLVLIYTDKGSDLIKVQRISVHRSIFRKIFGFEPTSYHIITSVRPELTNYKLTKVTGPDIEDELIKVYEPEFTKVMKVGVLYCRDGQREESEMLLNIAVNSSPEYNEFLEWIGEKVELQDFQGYNGGLDTQFGNSGTHSIYHKHNDVEVMFHVSTMLPFYPSDPKQIERKKHLGNDRIMIVFNDGRQPYIPNCMKSKQTLQPIRGEVATTSIALSTPISPTINPSDYQTRIPDSTSPPEVQIEQDSSQPSSSSSPSDNSPKIASNTTRYMVSIANRAEVPNFGPPLPNPPIFNKDDNFKNFLYEKMIAGSTSLRFSPVFMSKTQREKNLIFLNLVNKYSRESNGGIF